MRDFHNVSSLWSSKSVILIQFGASGGPKASFSNGLGTLGFENDLFLYGLEALEAQKCFVHKVWHLQRAQNLMF